MSLTREDLEQIKNVVVEVVDERVDPKIDAAINTIVTSTLDQFQAVIKLVDGIYDELAVIKDDVAVVKDYVKDHGFRIAKLERRTSS